MLRDEIKKDILSATRNLHLEVGIKAIDEIEVARISDPKFGDFTTNVALKVGKSERVKELKFDEAKLNQSPMEFAKVLSHRLQKQLYIKRLEVVKPGFLNFFIKDEIWQKQVEDVLKLGSRYGSNDTGKGMRARVEFVSANPTGPLHFGNARGGPIGDSLASVLEYSGYKVIREYLHNDVGVQVNKLGESILNVASGQKLEEQEYKGEYILDLVKKIEKTPNSKLQTPNTQGAGEEAVKILLDGILKDCQAMGIRFDEVYPEGDFIKGGRTKKTLDELDKKHFLKQKDGATWFAPSDEFLKDRETVVVKSDGSYTYFANDIAYHNLKFAQNPALVIDILGANHHGHVPRLQAVVKALGYDVAKFHVILYQWVRFKGLEESEWLTMSKRAGRFITAREALTYVGRDAVRFFILMHEPNSGIDFDFALAIKKSQKNPVYYVQYAHARIASILSKAKRLTTNVESDSNNAKSVNYELLTTNYELSLIKQITRLPELVEDIAQNFAVHRLTVYAIDLADSFHKFYENCRVIGEKEDLEKARIGLISATKITLANTLTLLGVSTPEKM